MNGFTWQNVRTLADKRDIGPCFDQDESVQYLIHLNRHTRSCKKGKKSDILKSQSHALAIRNRSLNL